MNIRVFFKSIKFAFRAKKRVIPFMMVYAILFIVVSDGYLTPNGLWYILMALIVSSFYAILISQFRRRDMSVFKCIGWSNNDVMLLVIGEVVLVTVASFLIMLQISFEIVGIVTYFSVSMAPGTLLAMVHDFIVIDAVPLFTTFLIVLCMQVPGLFIAQRRAMSVPPMKALREE
ncbi:MAG: FtsX-like permease family protein [Candidatus Thorarchaeota archaeon]